MKDMRKYLVAAVAAIVLVTAASTSSMAIINNNNNFSVPHKKIVGIQHKKPQISAHHVVTGPHKKNNDFANLNR